MCLVKSDLDIIGERSTELVLIYLNSCASSFLALTSSFRAGGATTAGRRGKGGGKSGSVSSLIALDFITIANECVVNN